MSIHPRINNWTLQACWITNAPTLSFQSSSRCFVGSREGSRDVCDLCHVCGRQDFPRIFALRHMGSLSKRAAFACFVLVRITGYRGKDSWGFRNGRSYVPSCTAEDGSLVIGWASCRVRHGSFLVSWDLGERLRPCGCGCHGTGLGGPSDTSMCCL